MQYSNCIQLDKCKEQLKKTYKSKGELRIVIKIRQMRQHKKHMTCTLGDSKSKLKEKAKEKYMKYKNMALYILEVVRAIQEGKAKGKIHEVQKRNKHSSNVKQQ